MAISSAQKHFSSISLPSRLHPNATKLEAELQKKADCITSEGIQSGLPGIAELYNCVDELMQSPTTQQLLVQRDQAGKIVEESLKSSVELLDSFGTIREFGCDDQGTSSRSSICIKAQGSRFQHPK
ncbi:hypothetical protein Fot_51689 [Forsythia ovata]|uniref:BLOC-1-related complex subunit 7 n=1 Tax=Forsythia ovata TaxID=205694 RepID=A0ABD1PX16_9LAMI